VHPPGRSTPEDNFEIFRQYVSVMSAVRGIPATVVGIFYGVGNCGIHVAASSDFQCQIALCCVCNTKFIRKCDERQNWPLFCDVV
jgi:hypothetical protein